MKIEQRHRDLFTRLSLEDRRWIAARISPDFPPDRVSLALVSSLIPALLDQLEARIQERTGKAA